jgi:hypothetical protein
MPARIRAQLTYANVMATIAVFLALGGGAYAAINLPAKSVGAKQLKNRAVTPKKVAPKTIALFKGQKGDVGLQGLQGIAGQQGVQGVQGQKGDTGSPGVSNWQVINAYSADDSMASKEAFVACPAGTQVIATNGQIFDNPHNSVALTALITFTDGSGARADAQEVVATASNWSVNVEAICATVGS